MEPLGHHLALGFALGLRHALDADHLAALATIVARNHRLRTAARIGAIWGFGHTASLLGVALVAVLIGFQLPEAWAVWTERGVAAMLIVLGGNVLWRLARGGRLHTHVHEHGPILHTHPHVHEHGHSHVLDHTVLERAVDEHAAREHVHSHERVLGNERTHEHEHDAHPAPHPRVGDGTVGSRDEVGTDHHPTTGKRPFFVGLVHGLAGSGALMVLVAASIPDRLTALLYVAVFGIGSVGGMLLMSAALSIPIARAARHSVRLFQLAQATAAVAALIIAIEIATR